MNPRAVLRPRRAPRDRELASLAGQRVLVTGAARGIGAAVAERLAAHGARVAVLGLEPELLAATAERVGGPWRECDVSDAAAVRQAVDELVTELGGLDVVVANAGIARQMPVLGGPDGILETHLRVNALGAAHTVRAADRNLTRPGGYVLLVSSLGAAIHLPLMAAYSASKAAVEAIGNSLRQELRPDGVGVGVAYFAELDTDMTTRGFGTEAGHLLTAGKHPTGVAPMEKGVDAVVRGIARRARTVHAPEWVGPLVPLRALAQRVVELKRFPALPDALARAREEVVDYTTPQPTHRPGDPS